MFRFAHQLDMKEFSINIRVKLCQLLELISTLNQELPFYQEVHFRNEMVAIVTQWIHDLKVQVTSEGTAPLRAHDLRMQ